MELLNDLQNDLRRKRGNFAYDMNIAYRNSKRDKVYQECLRIKE